MSKPLSNFFQNPIFQRFLVVLFITASILSTAASCSLNPFGGKPAVLGMLKQESGKGSFVKINSIKAINGKNDNEGLSNLAIAKTVQASKDVLFIQTEKAVYKTSDAGKNWQRIYIFPVVYTDNKDKQKELADQLNKNNDVTMQDFWVNSGNINNIYFAVKYQGVGKLFKTNDGGKTVKETYSSDEKTALSYVVIDPNDENHIYALLNQNSLIQSKDAGETWQKVSDKALETDKIVQIGVLPDNRTFFILYEKLGVYISADGVKWQKGNLKKASTKNNAIRVSSTITAKQIQETAQNTVANLQQTFLPETVAPFSSYTKIIFGDSTSDGEPNKSAILIADKEIWMTADLTTTPLTQITNIPTQDSKVDVRDVAVDFKNGNTTIYVAIDNRLWVSQNNGETWANKPIGVDNTGFISKITVDSTDTSTIYLSLSNKSK
jgi:photosystem II stability/assembly factor-like uncharacterized protein